LAVKRPPIALNGLTPDQLLSLSDETIDAVVLCGEPLVFRAGSADLLGRFWVADGSLVLELGYWCQRTLWESTWEGQSPIADPDYTPQEAGATTPMLRGVGLPKGVLDKVYFANAQRLLA
jgi:hypothetical protein